jgi:hypothetical protein
MKTNAVRGLVLALATLALGVDAASGQPKPEGRAAIVQQLMDCRKLTDDAARLACYDQGAAALDQAEAKGDVVIVDREQAQKVRKQAFGFTIPSISIFSKGEAKEEIDSFEGILASARQSGAGHWVFKLEDGAVWSQVAPEDLFRAPKPGMKVRIRKAALGSYMMTIDNQRGFKARRVE